MDWYEKARDDSREIIMLKVTQKKKPQSMVIKDNTWESYIATSLLLLTTKYMFLLSTLMDVSTVKE